MATTKNLVDALEFDILSFESGAVDYEYTLFQALVNEGKHIRVCPFFHANCFILT